MTLSLLKVAYVATQTLAHESRLALWRPSIFAVLEPYRIQTIFLTRSSTAIHVDLLSLRYDGAKQNLLLVLHFTVTVLTIW